jgi:hypothetical protein
VRDFKRHVKGLILESNTSIDLVQDNDNGALYHHQNKINTFLNNTIKEVVSIVRDTNANLLTKISQGKIIDGDMVFNTTENTYQQVIAGQLVSFGSGGGVDPALEGRVDDLESSVSDLESDVQAIVINQEEMDDNLAIARAELYDLINLTGMPENSDNLGPFSGAYLTDGLTIKEALQQLETAVEAELATTALDLSSINNQIIDLQDALDAESTNRINGDASTLAAANAYTDAEIASIPSTDLSAINGEIDTLQTNVGTLQTGVGSLQSQINTINNTTIPTAIDTAVASANSYTDSQIVSSSGVSQSDLYALLDIDYYENFEGTIKGTLNNGAVIKNASTDPLDVLRGQKSLYFSHANSTQSFISNVIEVPQYSNGCTINMFSLTTIPGDGTSLKALVRIFDITNNTYLALNRISPTDPLLTSKPILGEYGTSSGTWPLYYFNMSVTFNNSGYSNNSKPDQIRFEIVSNAVGTGITIIDNIKVSFY